MERRKVKAKAAGKTAAFSDFSVKRHRVYRYLIHYLYPNRCPACDRMIGYNDLFCDRCEERLVRYEKDFPVENADAFSAFCVYKGAMRGVILRFKENPCGNTAFAFAGCIFRALDERSLCDEIDVIAYIPMLRADLEKRGYNQTELIARELRYFIKAPCAELLEKCRKTSEQKSLDGDERKKNVLGAFRVVDAEAIRGKKILLLDDLCTTGSTLSEAAGALKEAGAVKVIAAVFAKTPYRKEDIEYIDETD
ncbi:MAG: double zinc ribbon domain-containing protein [Bacteroides sp.]|nr:double zinc ribbon domain-containing protein [Eubacterium sp.]MCM1417197.1 double zinc ribbon domain-containing protein [Roseburia sp.]MCM1461182.1 double zinc ribbon domain-containing protein [Bacteroides sp.]